MRPWPILLALCACAEPIVEMSLQMPAQLPAGFDVSCVTAVDVVGHTVGDEQPLDVGLRLAVSSERAPCVEIAPQTSLEGIRRQIAGKFELELEDLAAVQIRGRVGTCSDVPNYHEAIFYGGGSYDGGDMRIPLRPGVSCTARESYKVRPLDLAAMIADPAHACRAVTENLATFPGMIRPSMMAPALAPLIFEAGTHFSLLDASGTTTLQSFAASATAAACVAVAHEGQTQAGLTCVNKGAPLLCGTGSEVEIATFSFAYASPAISGNLYETSGNFVIGSVWETTPNKPVEGAVVTAPAGATVQYVEVRGGQLAVAPTLTRTGPSGLFLLYSPEVASITIAAAGHQTRTLTVAGGWELDGTVLAVLPKL